MRARPNAKPLRTGRRPLAPVALALIVGAAAGCTVFIPTEPEDRERSFCITQNEGESLLCCPSPGLGCQAAETTQ